MVYGNYISVNGNVENIRLTNNLPKHEDYVYYFGVNFPTRKKFILSNISVWIVFSSILLIAVIFFAYALFIILQQKRLSEQQRDFINNMTHEFKTPISSINLSSDVLLKPGVNDQPGRISTYARLIKQENERLNDQVEKVLNIARIERKGFTLYEEQFDAIEIIKDVVNSMLINNKVKITTDYTDLNAFVLGDKLHFTNIIFNVVDNAIKYSGENPEITIKAGIQKKLLKISLEDKGKCIEKEFQNRVFKKFY